MVSKWRAGSKEIPELMQQVRALVSKIILLFFSKKGCMLEGGNGRMMDRETILRRIAF